MSAANYARAGYVTAVPPPAETLLPETPSARAPHVERPDAPAPFVPASDLPPGGTPGGDGAPAAWTTQDSADLYHVAERRVECRPGPPGPAS